MLGTHSLVALLQHQLLWGIWGIVDIGGIRGNKEKGLQRQAMKIGVKKLTKRLF
jgi:hypothetical protein